MPQASGDERRSRHANNAVQSGVASLIALPFAAAALLIRRWRPSRQPGGAKHGGRSSDSRHGAMLVGPCGPRVREARRGATVNKVSKATHGQEAGSSQPAAAAAAAAGAGARSADTSQMPKSSGQKPSLAPATAAAAVQGFAQAHGAGGVTVEAPLTPKRLQVERILDELLDQILDELQPEESGQENAANAASTQVSAGSSQLHSLPAMQPAEAPPPQAPSPASADPAEAAAPTLDDGYSELSSYDEGEYGEYEEDDEQLGGYFLDRGPGEGAGAGAGDDPFFYDNALYDPDLDLDLDVDLDLDEEMIDAMGEELGRQLGEELGYYLDGEPDDDGGFGFGGGPQGPGPVPGSGAGGRGMLDERMLDALMGAMMPSSRMAPMPQGGYADPFENGDFGDGGYFDEDDEESEYETDDGQEEDGVGEPQQASALPPAAMAAG